MKEVWKDIQGFEGLYQISNLGRVKSLNYNKTGREQILVASPQHKDGSGYLSVALHNKGSQKSHYVHRLVAQAFIPNPQNLTEVNHRDEDKHNNVASNLEWCTKGYNLKYGTHNERSGRSRSKSVLQYTLDGQLIVEHYGTREASRHTGIPQSCIQRCCKGAYNSAGGYIWKYKETA